MPASSFQRNVIFLGVSVAAGIGVAALVLHLWPGGARPSVPPPTTAVAGHESPARSGSAAESDTSQSHLATAQGAEASDAASRVAQETSSPGSFAAAVRAAAPAVVSVYAQGTER